MTDRTIAVEGENCFRVAPANRVAFLIDADNYFSTLKRAILRARHDILVVGWDVHSRTPLGFDDDGQAPHQLAALLDHMAARRGGPTVRVLDWDSPLFYAIDRQWVPSIAFDWFTCNRVRFALDAAHPVGASQHQKLVVIDDAIAFCGGLDLTYRRLDDQCHAPDDPRRVNPDGSRYAPQHDVQVAVDGDAARALGAVARERWYRATGEQLAPSRSSVDPWPPERPADLVDVEVAVLRTLPAYQHFPAVREVERHYLDLIAAARQTIYMENQYLTATAIVDALAARLSEPDGPEVVLVLPESAHGWLERVTMTMLQARALIRLRAADAHRRLSVFTPLTGLDNPQSLHVHAKLAIVDGRIARIGSANLNNRSMGLDSECDVAIEAAPGTTAADAIARLRDRLLAEHLAVEPATVADAVAAQPGLGAAIRALSGGRARQLRTFDVVQPAELAVDASLLDPDAPVAVERVADELVRRPDDRHSLRSVLLRLAAIVALLLGLAALWHWGPLAALADPLRLQDEVLRQAGNTTVTVAVLAAYVVGGLLMFPVTVLIVTTGLLYGPLIGIMVALAGAMLGACAGFGVGMLLGRHGLRRLLRGRLDRISRQIARRGLLSMMLIRMLPVAPFTVINLVAGASHLRFRDFLLGSLLGMAPGIVAISAFAGQLGAVLREPAPDKLLVLFALLVLIAAAGIFAWRRLIQWRQASGS
jgi:phosphatidylserine/phosphatidylglycerophosphate/cardiolipin synthase-like enzyme/uncharacterized membrane protein YdjX (TVP38/TMEM64 family)